MKNIFPPSLISILCVFAICGCQKKMADACCAPATLAKNKSTVLTCKLSTKDLQDRKMTVLASLKKQMLERKELSDGYAFKFGGSDNVLNELTEFIKSERECCDFFTFNLSISGDKSEIWFELTGVEGAKEFITKELGL
ncbi:MAG: hypothetical protein WBP41_04930 [Saprospiraceae bacterium]